MLCIYSLSWNRGSNCPIILSVRWAQKYFLKHQAIYISNLALNSLKSDSS